jgi:hypothetical protein
MSFNSATTHPASLDIPDTIHADFLSGSNNYFYLFMIIFLLFIFVTACK